ncbi:MAG: transglutaminase-like domain-containing protein [Cyclobacteriaceae bacterium]
MGEEELKENELKALVSLLDEDDPEILSHVEQKIMSLGDTVIPYLEQQWEDNFNPVVQKRLEELIHTLQFDVLRDRLARWKEGEMDLLEGMWLIATYQYPDLELEKLRKELEQIYYEAWLEFKPDSHPFDQIKILNSVFFSKLRFSANTKNFHSVGNSMINIVLESKKGNPTSLCVIYMLVAQKLKLPVYGVNLPNLYILIYQAEEMEFYINVFNRGLIFSKSDIDNYLSHLNLSKKELFYEPCTNLETIKRIFRSLIVSFEKIGDPEKVEEVKLLLNTISDHPEYL